MLSHTGNIAAPPDETGVQGNRGNASTWTVGLLTPTASGSLGDQAMVEAATEVLAARGRRVVIGPNRFVTRSASVGARRTGRLSMVAGLAGMTVRACHVGLIGADVLDGVYNADSILKRLRTLQVARRLGAQARVFGSSWSETPSERVIAFLRAAHWLHLHARDPISQSRMEAVLERPVSLVADLAFLLRPELRSPAALEAARWIAGRRDGNATILGVNLSGHTLRGVADHGIGAVAGLVGRWLETDPERAVLLMPHDRRPGMVGDMQVLTELHQALAGRFADRMHMLPDTLDSWDLKALAGLVDLVLTGRMHLAIAALGMGTPALCIVYQGKFEGLMAHFGLDGLTVTPGDVTAERCDGQLAAMTGRRADLSARIRARLPVILDLSRRNLAGM